MFTNPFAELSASIPPAIMQTYVVVMLLLVVGGTLFDVMHKQSAKYFSGAWQKAKEKGSRQVGGGEIASLAIQTAAVEVLTSAEFCNPQRRVAHLLTMYGFLLYVLATVIMVFGDSVSGIWPALWYIGALMVCVGGYWFWFFIRADVASEGHSPFRLMRADLFIVSLLASATLGLIWAISGSRGPYRVPGSLSHRHDGAVRIGAVVEVLPYVLQARGGASRNGWKRRAARGATCRHPPTAPKSTAAPAKSPKTTDSPIIGLRDRS